MESTRDTLQSLISLLDLPDTDYWYDVGSVDARTVLDRGGTQLQENVLIDLNAWPSLRQEHLAYILGDSNAALEIQILSKLERSEDSEVAFRARESLRNVRSRDA